MYLNITITYIEYRIKIINFVVHGLLPYKCNCCPKGGAWDKRNNI